MVDRIASYPPATTSLSAQGNWRRRCSPGPLGSVLQISAIIFSMLSDHEHWRPARRLSARPRANVTGSLLENSGRRPQMKTGAPWAASPGKSPCRAPSAAVTRMRFPLRVSVEHERANPAIRIVAAQPGSHGFAKLIHYCTSSVNRSRPIR